MSKRARDSQEQQLEPNQMSKLLNDNTDFKILSINLGGGITDRNKRCALLRLLEDEDVDVALLQETKLPPKNVQFITKQLSTKYKVINKQRCRTEIETEYAESKLKELKGMNKSAAEQDLRRQINPKIAPTSGGLMFLFRSKWSDIISKGPLEDSKGRYCSVIIAESRDKATLLVNVYAPTGNKDSNAFFEVFQKDVNKVRKELQNKYKNLELIIGGDLNSYEDSKMDRKIAVNDYSYPGYSNFLLETQLVDIYRHKYPKQKEFTCIRNIKNKEGEMIKQETRIDKFLATKGLTDISRTRILTHDSTLSADHRPIEMKFHLNIKSRAEITGSIRKNENKKIDFRKHKEALDSLKTETFLCNQPRIKELTESLNDAIANLHNNSKHKGRMVAEEMLREITKEIKRKMDELFPTKAQRAIKIDYKLKMLKEIKRGIIETQDPSPSDKMDWKKKLKSIGDRIEIENISPDKLLRKIRNKIAKRKRAIKYNRININIGNLDVKELTEPRNFIDFVKGDQAKASTVTKIAYKGEVSTDVDQIADDWFPTYWQDIFQSKTKREEDLKGQTDKIITHEVNVKWDEDKAMKVLNKMAKHKSPGTDGIHADILQALHQNDTKIILSLLRYCWETKWIPDKWKESNIFFIPKVPDAFEIDKWRPIGLLQSMYKWLTSIVTEMLDEHLEGNKLLSDLQFGFRKHRSIQQQHTLIDLIVEDSNTRKKPLYATYIDFKRAFDSAEHWAIIDELEYYKVPIEISVFVREIYKDRKGHLLTPVGKSRQTIDIQRGIIQGDQLSTKLWIVYINRLLEIFEKEYKGYELMNGIRVPHTTYADDLSLFSESAEESQSMLNRTDEYGRKRGSEINSSKTFGTRTSHTPEHSLKLRDGDVLKLRPNENMEILGVLKNMEENLEGEFKRLKELQKIALHRLSGRYFTPFQKVRIYNKIFIPQIQFAFSLYHLDDSWVEELEKISLVFFIKQFRLHHMTLRDKLFDENTIGLKSIEETQRIMRVASIYNNGLNSPNNIIKSTYKYYRDNKVYSGPINYLETQLERWDLKIDQKPFEPIDRKKIISDEEIQRIRPTIVNTDGDRYFVMATDGSLIEGKAGCGISFNETQTISWRTAGKQTVPNAELQALEILLEITENIEKDLKRLIIIDSEGIIKALESESTDKWSANRIEIDFIKGRLGSNVRLLWVPSHSNERILNENKMERLQKLRSRYGKDLDLFISLNEKADKAAQRGKDREKLPTPVKSNEHRIYDQELIFEGKLSKELRTREAQSRIARLLEHNKSKETTKGTVDYELSNAIFTHRNGREHEMTLGFLLRMRYGGIKSLENNFKAYQTDLFDQTRHKIIYHTDKCLKCGVLADTKHITLCNFNEKKIIEKVEAKLKIGRGRLAPWWDDEADYEYVDQEQTRAKNEKEKKKTQPEQTTLTKMWNIPQPEIKDDIYPPILKRKREETEKERKSRKAKKRPKINARSAAAKGYLTTELIEKIKKERPDMKKTDLEGAAAYILEQFAKEAKRSHHHFWSYHFKTLEQQGVPLNQLTLHEKKPAVT